MGRLDALQTLLGHRGSVWNVSWNPSRTLLATCGEDKIIHIWGQEGPIWVLKHCLEGIHQGTIWQTSWSPIGSLLASASFDAKAAIWQIDIGQSHCSATLEGHEYEVKSVSWSRTGQFLATGSSDKTVWIWKLLNDYYVCVAMLTSHTDEVNKVLWHPYLDVLASASYDNTVKLYREDIAYNDWTCTASLISHESTVWTMAFDNTGLRLATCSADLTVKIWQEYLPGNAEGIDTPEDDSVWICTLTLYDFYAYQIYDIAWCHLTGLIATACGDNAIRILKENTETDPSTFVCIAVKHNAHSEEVKSLAWNPSHPGLLASAGDQDEVKLWLFEN